MDLEKVIAELQVELKEIDHTIYSLEHFSGSVLKRRGRLPKSIAEIRARNASGLALHPSQRTQATSDGKPHK